MGSFLYFPLSIYLLFIFSILLPSSSNASYFSDDNIFVESSIWQTKIMGITKKAEVYIYDKDSGELEKKIVLEGYYQAGGISENGRFAVVATSKDKRRQITLIDAKLRNISRQYTISENVSGNGEMRTQVADDGSMVLFTRHFSGLLYNLKTGYLIWSSDSKKVGVETHCLSPSGRFMVATPNHFKHGYLRSDFTISLFRINKEIEEVELVKNMRVTDLKLKLRKQFGRSKFRRNSINFSRLDDRFLYLTFSGVREGEKNDRYFLAKVSLETEKTLAVLDYGSSKDASVHWNTSYKYDNTLCELSDNLVVTGYETRILVGDLQTNKLQHVIRRRPIFQNPNTPEIGCSEDGQFFTHVTTSHPEIKKPTIHLWQIENGKAVEVISKLAKKELQEARRHAEISRKEKEKQQEAERIAREKAQKEKTRLIQESLRSTKEVGDFICLNGKVRELILFSYDVTLKGYVENVSGKKIQIRITDHGGYLNYKDVELQRDSLIWDDHRSWFDCNLQ